MSARRATAILLLLTLVGVGLRIWGLWDRPLWDDEISTIHYSQQSIARMEEVHPSRDSSPLGFYVFSHFYNRVGVGHIRTRLPMVIASSISILLIYRLGRTVASRRASLAAAALMAINPLAIACSQDARMQSIVLMFSLAGSWALIRLVQGRSLLWAIVLAVSAGAMINLHYNSMFLFAAWAVLILIFCVRLFSARPAVSASPGNGLHPMVEWAVHLRSGFASLATILAAIGLAAMSFLPSLKMLFVQLMRGQSWRPPIGIVELALKIGIYFSYGATDDHFPTLIGPLDRLAGGHIVAGILILAAISLPFWCTALYGMLARLPGRGAMAVLAWTPLVCLAVATRVINLFDIRHVLFMLPPILICAAIGLEKTWSRSRGLAAACGAWIALTSGMSLNDYYNNPDFIGQDFRLPARIIEQRMGPDDVLASYHPEKTYGLTFYLPKETNIEYLFDDQMLGLPPDQMELRLEQRVSELLAQHRRIWLFDYHGKVYDFLDRTRELFKRRAYNVERWQRGREPKGFSLDLFTTDASTAAASFSSEIDLRPGVGSDRQVLDGLYPQSPEGRWMGPAAHFIFPAPKGRSRACCKYLLHQYLGAEPATVSMFQDGRLIGKRSDRPPLEATLCADLEQSTEPLLRIGLECDRSFVPAEVDRRLKADTSPKTIFLFKVWLEKTRDQ